MNVFYTGNSQSKTIVAYYLLIFGKESLPVGSVDLITFVVISEIILSVFALG